MKALKGVNLALRFALELGALAAVGYWGWKLVDGALRLVLALAAVSALAVVWGLFVSPKARVEIARPVQFAIELAVWAAAGAALYGTDHPGLAFAFVTVAVLSGALNYVWG